ncbi:mechanosensitive ion channel family protein [Gloeobacter morelensis]|uniref:Mechanosensitive ion channel family protein n=1 Tax=Gloeobacter morelensis MG652769 TaxID=2781736 RepID=A0ABY3PRC4_9CYAN|nr:mechanosensitive ion channel family protein [Gloeobacter morelensis]UFP96093.1 mechanosensitive ion channel family protein [Gloeobacter morelensis MG652769]
MPFLRTNNQRQGGDGRTRLRRTLGICLGAALLSAWLIAGWARPTQAQLSLSGLGEQANGSLPEGVKRLGEIEIAPVKFEGMRILDVASPTVRNRASPGKLIPVEVRAELIEASLARIVAPDVRLKVVVGDDGQKADPAAPTLPPTDNGRARDYFTNYDPKSTYIYISKLNGANVIFAIDDYHTNPLKIVTVTAADADYYGLTQDDLAERWRSLLERLLANALRERQPADFDGQFRWAALAVGAVAGIGLLIWLLQKLIKSRDRQLAAQQAQQAERAASQAPAPAEDAPAENFDFHRRQFLEALRQQFSLQRRRSLIAILGFLLNWAQAVAWVVGATVVLYIFPWTRAYAIQVLRIPVVLLGIWFVAGLANRIGDAVIERFSKVWEENDLFDLADVQRKSLRITTTIQALKGLKTFVIYLAAIGSALSFLGVPLGSVLAIGGLVAFAISFSLQNLVKDLVNGCLILWEDQFAIGDVVAIGAVSGAVENLSLRVTQLRNSEGRLITIPNSAIVQVENLTRTWSRVDFAVEVAYDTDIRRALAVLGDIARTMYDEPEWHTQMLEAPQVLGVDALSSTGALIRVWLRTQPGQQWAVGREFRLRVRLALEQNHIEIGTPQQALLYKGTVPLPNGNSGAGSGSQPHPGGVKQI